MPREPKEGTWVVEDVDVDPPTPYIQWMMVDQSAALPVRFSARFRLSEPMFVINMDLVMEGSRAVAQRLEVVRGRVSERGFIVDAEGGVTTTNLRQILVDRLIRLAVEKARRPIEVLPPEVRAAVIRGGAVPPAVERGDASMFRIPGAPEGQFQFSPSAEGHVPRDSTKARVVEAARLFRRAVANGSKSPQKDVALATGMSTSQVSRYLKSARGAGLLDEPKKPVSEMPPEDRERMLKGMGTSELDPERNPLTE